MVLPAGRPKEVVLPRTHVAGGKQKGHSGGAGIESQHLDPSPPQTGGILVLFTVTPS